VAVFGPLAGLLTLDGIQGLASLLQHPAKLAKSIAKHGEGLPEGELHVGGGRLERALHRLDPLQQESSFGPQPRRLLAFGPKTGEQLQLERLLELGFGRGGAVFPAEPLDHGLEGLVDVAAAGGP